VSPKIEDWNKQMQEMGACLTQTIEEGDRLLYQGLGSTESNTEIIVAKLRYPHQVRIDSFEIVVERTDVHDKLGLHVQQSLVSPNRLDVVAVLEEGLIPSHSGAHQVLPGDHLVAVNGKEEYNEIMLQLHLESRATLRFERYVAVSIAEERASAPALPSREPDAQTSRPSIIQETVQHDSNSNHASAGPEKSVSAGVGRMEFLILVLCIIIVLSFWVGGAILWMKQTKPAKDSRKDLPDVAAGEAPRTDGPVVSEYAKWMEGASDVASASKDVLANKDHSSASLTYSVSWVRLSLLVKSKAELLHRSWETAYEWSMDVWRAAKGEARSYIKERRESKLSRARARVSKLEERINRASEDDDGLAIHALEGQCLSARHMGYKYEICFFKNAKQDSMSIGHWRHWEAPNIALFDGGRECHAGPERSLRVKVRCGADEKIADIGEPSRCSYEATMIHPMACSEKSLKELIEWHGPRMPHTQAL